MLRVIGGAWRGRLLRAPAQGVRPTADRVREAIFNLLGQRLDGERVLDLFAGSGALGIEALSRGAREAVFVERSHRHAEVIRRNLEALGAAAQARVVVVDAARFVAAPAVPPFDTVLADPPYRDLPPAGFWSMVLEHCVAPGGRLLVEHAARDGVALVSGRDVQVRRYGDSAVTLGRRSAAVGQRADVASEDPT